MSDNPDELQAALEQLEAERGRRIQAKLDAGTAVRGTPTIVGGPESIAALPTHDAEGREILYGPDDVGIIITGVPRPEIDEKFYARLMRQREIPNTPLANAPREEPSRIPGPLLRTAPHNEKPPQPKRIVVQRRECQDY